MSSSALPKGRGWQRGRTGTHTYIIISHRTIEVLILYENGGRLLVVASAQKDLRGRLPVPKLSLFLFVVVVVGRRRLWTGHRLLLLLLLLLLAKR